MSYGEIANHSERLHQRLGQAWQLLEKNPHQAGQAAREVEHLARTVGDNRAWADGLFIWAVGSLYAADTSEAITLASRALAVYRFLGHPQGQWSCLSLIATAWRYLGDGKQAQESHRQATFVLENASFEQRAIWLKWFK